MPADETVCDPSGRAVVMLASIWQSKIVRDHPEMAGYLPQVLDAVASPDHVADDPLPSRRRYYKRGAGPSRWLLVVVSFEQQPGRIITALGNRKPPKQ